MPGCKNRAGGDEMRILVVEDERDLNRIICKRLAAAGYSTDACYDGRGGLG